MNSTFGGEWKTLRTTSPAMSTQRRATRRKRVPRRTLTARDVENTLVPGKLSGDEVPVQMLEADIPTDFRDVSLPRPSRWNLMGGH
jgi:hypothetical protein